MDAVDLNQSTLSKVEAEQKFPQVQEKRVQQVEIAKDTIQGQVALALEMMKAGEVPKIDISKLPHYASLSSEIQKHFFNGNRVDYQLPNFKTGDIEHRGQEPKVEGNLQYLIGPEGVSSYLALSKEHQQFIQDLANLLLTDEYAKNIEKQIKIDGDDYKLLDGEYDTFAISEILEESIKLLIGIQSVERGIEDGYNNLIKILNEYKDSVSNPKIKAQLNTTLTKIQSFEGDIKSIIKTYKFLDQQVGKMEMDNRKREKIILAELSSKKAELSSKKAELSSKKAELSSKKTELSSKKAELRELENYIKTLNRFLDLTGRSQ